MKVRLFWLMVGLVAGVAGYRMVSALVPSVGSPAAETKVSVASEKSVISRVNSAPATTAVEPVMPAPVPDSISLLKALRTLKGKNLLSYYVNVFDGKHRLTSQARELFHLTEAEAAAIDDLSNKVERQIAEIGLNTATAVLAPDKQTLVISVPPFPDKGGKIYDEVCRRVNEIVGPERGALILEVSRMEEQYTQFGVGVREITIKKKTGDGTRRNIEVNDNEKTDPREIAGKMTYGSSSGHGSTYSDRESVIENLGSLAQKFLPADF